MFAGLGRVVHRRRLTWLLLCLIFVVFSGVWGPGAIGRLKGGGFDDPHSSSSLVAKLSAQYFSNSTPDIFVIYRSSSMTVDDPRFRGAVDSTLARLPKDKIRNTLTYWSQTPRVTELAAKDKHATFAAIQLAGEDAAKTRTYDEIKDRLAAPGLSTQVGGGVALAKEFTTQTSADLSRAESISLPVLFVLLLVVFGSIGSFWLPLVVGVFAVVGGMTVLRLLTMITDVSTFSAQVVTMMGLGLAIDYSLFIVKRFREELARGVDRESALANTMATAGRTVTFSGITVTTALGGMLLFPQMFLRSVGLGGMAVVVVAVLGALFLLPALLALLGPRVEFGRMPWRRRTRVRDDQHGFWYRLATSVMRRPTLYFVGVMTVLAVLTAPFLHVKFGVTDARVLPRSSPNRQLFETFQRDFPVGSKDPIDVVLSGEVIPKNFVPTPKNPVPEFITSYEGKLRKLPGVTSVEITGYADKFAAVRISVRHQYPTISGGATRLVREVRAIPPEREALYADVGGSTAAQMDMMDSLKKGLPAAGAVIGLMTFILLFLAFGSVVLPVKAVVMNLLSLGASFGAIVWGFQDGHLAGVLGFTSTGTIEPTTIILVLLTVFGLSMDYEVFLLSRVREEWDRTHDNRRAVATGLQRTGGIISSAALLFLVVIAVFSTADITLVKLIGVGMFVAIVVDASLVRMLLVPATMRFLGPANWWLPTPLARLHAHLDLTHPTPPPPDPKPLTPPHHPKTTTPPTRAATLAAARAAAPTRLREPAPPRQPAPVRPPEPARNAAPAPVRPPVRQDAPAREVEPAPVRPPARQGAPARVREAAPPRQAGPAQEAGGFRAREVAAVRRLKRERRAARAAAALGEKALREASAGDGRGLSAGSQEASTERGTPRTKREIVPNPDGPGWHWKTSED